MERDNTIVPRLQSSSNRSNGLKQQLTGPSSYPADRGLEKHGSSMKFVYSLNEKHERDDDTYIPQYGGPVLYGGTKNEGFKGTLMPSYSKSKESPVKYIDVKRPINISVNEEMNEFIGYNNVLNRAGTYSPATTAYRSSSLDELSSSSLAERINIADKVDERSSGNSVRVLSDPLLDCAIETSGFDQMIEIPGSLLNTLESAESFSTPELGHSYTEANMVYEKEGTSPGKSVHRGSNINKSNKPAFHLPLDDLKHKDAMLSRMNEWMADGNQSGMDHEASYADREFIDIDSGLFQAKHDVVTPSMKPPGTNNREYFEPYHSNDDLRIVDTDIHRFDYFAQLKDKIPKIVTPKEFDKPGPFLSGVDYFDINVNGIDQNNELKPPPKRPSHSKFLSESNIVKVPINSQNQDDQTTYQNRIFVPSNRTFMEPNGRPIFERTDSSQSAASIGSTGSVSRKKRASKGAVCSICDKYISRDLTRHMRIHDEVGRFQCVYPKNMCNHKTGHFNRPYDYKKHLLHTHFKFDDPKGKTAHTLTDKLPLIGTCLACGFRATAAEWLDLHILTKNAEFRCGYLGAEEHNDIIKS